MTARRKKRRGGALAVVAPGPPTAEDELLEALSGEIQRCSKRAAEQAELLESIAAHSFDLSYDIFADLPAPDLAKRGHAIRGLVAHALGVIAELRGVAGQLEVLAALRGAAQAAESVPEGEEIP